MLKIRITNLHLAQNKIKKMFKQIKSNLKIKLDEFVYFAQTPQEAIEYINKYLG